MDDGWCVTLIRNLCLVTFIGTIQGMFGRIRLFMHNRI